MARSILKFRFEAFDEIVCIHDANGFCNFVYRRFAMRQTVCSVLHSDAIQIGKRRDANFLFELRDQMVWGNIQFGCHVLHGDCLRVGVLQIIQCTDRQVAVVGGLFSSDGLTVFADQPFMFLIDLVDGVGIPNDGGTGRGQPVVYNGRNPCIAPMRITVRVMAAETRALSSVCPNRFKKATEL